MNELLLNQTLNSLSNFSIGNGQNNITDILNTNMSANFLNLSASSSGNNSTFNKSQNSSSSPNASMNGGLSPSTLALLKQRQLAAAAAAVAAAQTANNRDRLSGLIGSNNGNGNIAALASASSNMASLLSNQFQQGLNNNVSQPFFLFFFDNKLQI
jgi:hypothetical protein